MRRCQFYYFVGRGPLISRLSLSNGEVPLISLPSFLINHGFSSLQTGHEFVTFLVSSMEKGKFLVHIQWFTRVIPG
jgi:hypothetical protein